MKFIACYEDTAIAKEALKEAQKHAKVWDASIEVLQIVERQTPIKRDRIEMMEKELEKTVAVLFEENDLEYRVQLKVGDINKGEEIVRMAKRRNADLIFMGIKHYSSIGKAMFGSTAQYVILKSQCPVFTVNKNKRM